tara:strand:+ start:75 stop:239 length:165 start_codon:yes stop_codon:yes gene_type:complete
VDTLVDGMECAVNRYIVTLSNGERVTTFAESDALALDYVNDERAVKVILEKTNV